MLRTGRAGHSIAMRLAVLALVIAGAGAAGWEWCRTLLAAPSQATAGTRIIVHPKSSLRTVLTQLASAHALAHPRVIELYLRLSGQGVRAQAGTYELAPGASAAQILQQLRDGQVLLEQLTVVEGWTFAQMRQAMNASGALSHEWRGLDDAALMRALGEPGVSAEGHFYPDSYRFAAGTSDKRIYELALQRMNAQLAMEWQTRDPSVPVANAGEALILASIIEKETGREDERSRVAAVFVNRLRLGMRLQTDPTIIYGLGDRYDGNLHRVDLETDGPYNSYTRAGLPPTPIALPGAASLHAALHPADEKILYFVATGLGDGSHHFSSTYAEHNLALRSYLHRIGAKPDAAVGGGS